MLLSMESLSNSRIARTAVACCYAGNHKGIIDFQGHCDSNFEKSHRFQIDAYFGF